MLKLTREQGLIFRITHVENLPWIAAHGVHCRNSQSVDPNFREIGNQDLIRKRTTRIVPVAPGGTLSDYVPFYFTPCSKMLLNILTGYNGVPRRNREEIAVLVTSVPRLVTLGRTFLLTDRHASLAPAVFTPDESGLDRIDWPLLRSRDFKTDPNDPGKGERYQAEALVHDCLLATDLLGIACYDQSQVAGISSLFAATAPELQIVARPGYYFV